MKIPAKRKKELKGKNLNTSTREKGRKLGGTTLRKQRKDQKLVTDGLRDGGKKDAGGGSRESAKT